MTSDRVVARTQKQVETTVERLIAAGREEGVQFVAYLGGDRVIEVNAGVADPRTGARVARETLFNVYSVTKAVAVTALHLQVERGRLLYDAPVVQWWPEYGANGKQRTTVRDVITHRAGVPQMPDGVTPETMCDWDAMVAAIAALKPLAEPGSRALYQSMTFGWLVGELVRRSDPARRSIGRFVREEIAEPLGLTDLWIGLPDEAIARVAKLSNASVAPVTPPPLYTASMPPAVDLIPEVFERPDVRRAEIPGVGGIFNARSCAGFWAMLAGKGELGGTRLLSPDRVMSLCQPRGDMDEPDEVMFGSKLPISQGGFWLGGPSMPVACARHPRVICHPGAGNSFGWADPATNFAAAFCHNRMLNARSPEEDSTREIADALWDGLGLD